LNAPLNRRRIRTPADRTPFSSSAQRGRHHPPRQRAQTAEQIAARSLRSPRRMAGRSRWPPRCGLLRPRPTILRPDTIPARFVSKGGWGVLSLAKPTRRCGGFHRRHGDGGHWRPRIHDRRRQMAPEEHGQFCRGMSGRSGHSGRSADCPIPKPRAPTVGPGKTNAGNGHDMCGNPRASAVGYATAPPQPDYSSIGYHKCFLCSSFWIARCHKLLKMPHNTDLYVCKKHLIRCKLKAQ
jgi:hypothetical protein